VKLWWRSGHLSARRSDLRKSLQMDGQTDDGRLAIALAHSWNELKTVETYFLSELSQISTDCENFWQKDSKEDKLL